MVIDFVFFQGIIFCLLVKRLLDNFNDGFVKWFFISVEFWDENLWGEWIVMIRDEKVMDLEIRKIKLIIYVWLKEKKVIGKINRIDDLKNQLLIDFIDKRCLNKGII